MSKRTVEKIEQSAQVKRIIELAREAQSGATEARKRIKLSVDAAIKCGKLLLAEKKMVTKEMGRGYWLSYYDINFEKILPGRTARHWMALASKLELAIANSTRTGASEINKDEKTEFLPDENVLRLGMLSLDLFPKKVQLEIESDAPAPSLTTHLALLGRIEEWIDGLVKRQPKLDQKLRDQLRADFRKTHEFCQVLFAE